VTERLARLSRIFHVRRPRTCQGCGRGSVGGRNSLTGLDKGTGVSDGVRTRDFRSHSRTSDDREESEH
jgi:hypothetical protein